MKKERVYRAVMESTSEDLKNVIQTNKQGLDIFDQHKPQEPFLLPKYLALVSAGAVLVLSIGAVILGLLIFLPRLFSGII